VTASLALNNLLVWSLQAGLLVARAAMLPPLLRLKMPDAKLAFWQFVLAACRCFRSFARGSKAQSPEQLRSPRLSSRSRRVRRPDSSLCPRWVWFCFFSRPAFW
jgi:hypothetical protein